MTNLQSKTENLTPEQRRLLAETYRLILSWKHDEPNPIPSSSDVPETTQTGQRVKQPEGQVHRLSEKKQGETSCV